MDVVLFGQADPAPINVDEVAERFDRARTRSRKVRAPTGFASAIDLL